MRQGEKIAHECKTETTYVVESNMNYIEVIKVYEGNASGEFSLITMVEREGRLPR
jgi:hypothetical protein